jgi:hypothetical protein
MERSFSLSDLLRCCLITAYWILAGDISWSIIFIQKVNFKFITNQFLFNNSLPETVIGSCEISKSNKTHWMDMKNRNIINIENKFLLIVKCYHAYEKDGLLQPALVGNQLEDLVGHHDY